MARRQSKTKARTPGVIGRFVKNSDTGAIEPATDQYSYPVKDQVNPTKADPDVKSAAKQNEKGA